MDIKLHYTETGSGDPLILLHGNGENGSYFEHQIACFSNQYRVIAVDTRGHGKSPRGNAPFTIRQFAEDLRHLMDQLQMDRAILLGFSDGGNIALVFALNYPERVEKLILNGANLDAKGVKRTVQLPIEIGYRIAKLFGGAQYMVYFLLGLIPIFFGISISFPIAMLVLWLPVCMEQLWLLLILCRREANPFMFILMKQDHCCKARV